MKIISKALNWLDKAYSVVTGRTHNYFVILGYRPKGHKGPQMCTIQQTFSMERRCSRNFYRVIRKEFAPSLVAAIPKHRLDNGRITIEKITYLGRY